MTRTGSAAEHRPARTGGASLLLPFVVVAFAANSLITRHVVAEHLLDAGLLSAVRFVAGALALTGLALSRGERRSSAGPTSCRLSWLGLYATCISYGYSHIGAAAGARSSSTRRSS